MDILNYTEDHHHFYIEDTCVLQDIPAAHVRLLDLPRPPDGTHVSRVDVVIRVESDAS